MLLKVESSQGKDKNPTRNLNNQLKTRLMRAQGTQRKTAWGTAFIKNATDVVLHIADAQDPIVLPSKDKITIGRSDPNTSQFPDVDLTPFGAVEDGVSRSHACLQRTEDDTLNLIDMDSSNGTYLNGQRLIPHQPRILHDGDEIRVGRLTFRIYF